MRRDTVQNQALYARVGRTIQALRLSKRLSRPEFSKRIGVTPTFLERIEDSTTACPLHVLVKIADEFDTTLDELVPVEIDEREEVA